uniref:Uncharacterized protein n=1 Tax=Athene cunicularia TaxID=194338 RepID=A0A663NCV0_ATHCN
YFLYFFIVSMTPSSEGGVLYKEDLGTGIPTPVTPEIERRVKRNQENISSVLYKEGLGIGTPVPVTPEMERVKRNQENFSSVLLLSFKKQSFLELFNTCKFSNFSN